MADTRRMRQDWMPKDRTEVCACISVLALNGRLTPEDEQFIAGWIAFRRTTTEQPHSPEVRDV